MVCAMMRVSLAVVVLAMVFLIAGIIGYSEGFAAAPSITTFTTTATVTAVPKAVSVTTIYGVAANATGVMVFTSPRNGDLLYGYYNGTHYIVFDITKNSVVSSFGCRVRTIVAGYTGYVVCDTSVYDVYLGSKVYSLPDVPSFLVYDYYSDRILAFINSYPVAATVVVFDTSGRTIYSGTWLNWMVYGAAANSDSYYILMYNAASGWWLVRYDKGFSILANISVPTPMNNNVAVAKYSAFAANDYGVILINGDGSAVMYDKKNLRPLFTVPGSGYTRAVASKYHFYLMDSAGKIYAASSSGVVYVYGVTGDIHYARVSKEFWGIDKGVAYNASGYLYILDAPSDLMFVTTTSTVYMLQLVTRTFTSTETTTVYGFVPAYSSVALFIALVVLVAGIYFFLKKK